MVEEFQKKKIQPIYDPDEFEIFCLEAGAETIFDNFQKAICTIRQTEQRIGLNRKKVVSVIYQLCFGLSQRCNFMQKDNTIFMMSENMNKEALNTQRQLGLACSSQTAYRHLHSIESSYKRTIENAIENAIDNEHLIICNLDDYHNIHTQQRPNQQKASKATHMATLVFRVYPEIKAIKLTTGNHKLHNPVGIDDELCVNHITGHENMLLFRNSYVSVMPQWLHESFFDPKMTTQRLNTHEYQQSENVRKLRSMDNLYLLEFKEMPLKCFSDFKTGMQIFIDSPLKSYLNKFVVILPGDHPMQFFFRQIVYSETYNKDNSMQDAPANIGDKSKAKNEHIALLKPRNPFQSFAPFIGGLHIQLNAVEDVVQNYHSIMKFLYENLFPNAILALKPRPWRSITLLEVIHGGWTLIRETVLETFSKCKSISYGILLTLLDTYIPLSITIYSVTFKTNNFNEFKRAMARIWTMFLCFHRHHYNKSPLVWFSNILFWEKNNKVLYDTLKDYISIQDEYGVENCHSIIRGNTNPWDTADQLTFKAKSLFASKDRQHNFRSHFTPPKSYTFSRKQLTFLKYKCAELLVNKIFVPIASGTDLTHFLPAEIPSKSTILPLGFHTDWPPSENRICDMPGCLDKSYDKPWVRFDGCWHSYHVDCLGESDICQICAAFLSKEIRRLSQVAQEAIFNPGGSTTQQSPDDDSPVESIAVGEMSDQELEININKLLDTIEKIAPPTPLSQTNSVNITSQSKPKKKAHCKQCGHLMQGHKRPKDQPIKCPTCPSGVCRPDGKKTVCPCSDHKTSDTSQLSTMDEFKIEQIGTVNVFSLKDSQGTLSSSELGSNACTVISIYTALKFMQNNMTLGKNFQVNRHTASQFKELMREGNIIYDIIDPPAAQPNLFVEDVIKSINFPFNCPSASDLIIITDADHFERELYEKLVHPAGNNCMIVIVPLDKSMLICSNDDNVYLFESHKHGDRGAIIATAKKENIKHFIKYLTDVWRQEWNKGVIGTNLIPLKLSADA